MRNARSRPTRLAGPPGRAPLSRPSLEFIHDQDRPCGIAHEHARLHSLHLDPHVNPLVLGQRHPGGETRTAVELPARDAVEHWSVLDRIGVKPGSMRPEIDLLAFSVRLPAEDDRRIRTLPVCGQINFDDAILEHGILQPRRSGKRLAAEMFLHLGVFEVPAVGRELDRLRADD